MKNDPGPQIVQNDNDEVPTASFNVNHNYAPPAIENLDDDATNTLALGYSFIDVQDEDNEGTALTCEFDYILLIHVFYS